ncbi:pseudaminic acid synthase [Agarivorans aestuarii]|uniref:Pseudaminic acid synthase n=1 Tax=Agarivorans aestuarii TaxID=1563703 RepID=A0ABU7G144_9ALTE|nr:pseudaminic acid synthase [Agarivorans aestuarii]MEE1672894.1 pseudaminic acid synthase [Agarivorans aestuarii]
MNEFSIEGRQLGQSFPPYIIAELSANHNGSLEKALDTMVAIKNAGADAIKIQSYTPDTMTIESDMPGFLIEDGLWKGQSLYQLYSKAYTPFEWHKTLFDKANELNITLFSSPFDESAVDLLESLNAPAYKIASFELVDLPLIAYVAKTGKPMIMSTGMANLEEVSQAVQCAKHHGCKQLVLLHCISAYPSPIEQANLNSMNKLAEEFDCLVGLSDHSIGHLAAISATALGASVIEKHVTLDRNDGGPDSSFSLEPQELKELCEVTKQSHAALGSSNIATQQAEQTNLKFRRSVYFVQDLPAGCVIEAKHLRRIRPGYGLAPKELEQLIGKTLLKDVLRGTPTAWDLVK